MAAAPALNPGEAASLDSLKKLETLRQSLEVLTKYNRQGAPWGYRWGLYIGDDLYPDVRKLYFAHFHRMLLAPTQETLVTQQRGLPSTPGPTDEYTGPYKTLKAYLKLPPITTKLRATSCRPSSSTAGACHAMSIPIAQHWRKSNSSSTAMSSSSPIPIPARTMPPLSATPATT
ncbi:MAG: ImcF-related family protein [Ignavibacteriota bacterium]